MKIDKLKQIVKEEIDNHKYGIDIFLMNEEVTNEDEDKIRSMNELNKDKYWKRTNTHIYKIKERLINIVNSIKELDQ